MTFHSPFLIISRLMDIMMIVFSRPGRSMEQAFSNRSVTGNYECRDCTDTGETE